MPKAKKVILCRDNVQVYPADEAEDVWHVCDEDGPIAEIQFISGPVDTEVEPELVLQDYPDFMVLSTPERYHFWEDRRESPPAAFPGAIPGVPKEPGIYWLFGHTEEGEPAVSLFRVGLTNPASRYFSPDRLALAWTRIDIPGGETVLECPDVIRAYILVARPDVEEWNRSS